MEAATPLRPPRVRVLVGRVIIEGLVVDDGARRRSCAPRRGGRGPGALVCDAVEIGARVLDREQAGANAEFVRAEFEKTSREVEAAFTDKARAVAEFFDKASSRSSGPRTGSSAACSRGCSATAPRRRSSTRCATPWPRLAARARSCQAVLLGRGLQPAGRLPARAAARAARQSASARSAAARDASEARARRCSTRSCWRRARRGRGGGRARALDRQGPPIRGGGGRGGGRDRRGQGDDCDAVGRPRGAGGRKGDVVVGIDGCAGPSRGRIVFEAKHSRSPAAARWTSSTRRWPSATPTTRVWVVPRRSAAGPHGRAARGQRRQAVRRLRPAGRVAARARGGLQARPRPRADGAW